MAIEGTNKIKRCEENYKKQKITMPDDGVRLFVYGIQASCPRDLLEDKFGKCGRVTDVYNTGKGFAFVTMEDDRGAQDAIEELHQSTIDGQEVKVELSKPRSGGKIRFS